MNFRRSSLPPVIRITSSGAMKTTGNLPIWLEKGLMGSWSTDNSFLPFSLKIRETGILLSETVKDPCRLKPLDPFSTAPESVLLK